jgi:mitogen-activated protein kinase 1/3
MRRTNNGRDADDALLSSFFGGDDEYDESAYKRYRPLKIVGKGTYGVVCSAVDTLALPGSNPMVAIKRIGDVFSNASDALRILRELVFLRAFRSADHPNIVTIKDVLLPNKMLGFNKVFIVFELMECSLNDVIETSRESVHRDSTHRGNVQDARTFIYQLLRSVAFHHHAGILHRDIKPANVLVDTLRMETKLCDFGLARCYGGGWSSGSAASSSGSDSPMSNESDDIWSDYVTTRWYRPPELCGSFCASYKKTSIDIWSIGCIFGELLVGRPLLRGKDGYNQLYRILLMIGKPTRSEIDGIPNPRAREYVRGCVPENTQPIFDTLFHELRRTDPLAIDLLKWMLSFSASDRPTAAEALQHDYFSGLPDGLSEGVQQDADRVRDTIRNLSRLDDGSVDGDMMRYLVFKEIGNWGSVAI